jgi:hypothetical protein
VKYNDIKKVESLISYHQAQISFHQQRVAENQRLLEALKENK